MVVIKTIHQNHFKNCTNNQQRGAQTHQAQVDRPMYLQCSYLRNYLKMSVICSDINIVSAIKEIIAAVVNLVLTTIRSNAAIIHVVPKV